MPVKCLPEIYLRRLNILMRVFMKNMKNRRYMARKRLLETLPKEMQNSYKPYVVDMEKDELWP